MALLKEITILLLIHILSLGSLVAQSIVLDSISSFSNSEAAFKKPVWSPDGKHILITSADNDLYCINKKEGSIVKMQTASGFKTDVGWHNSSTVQYKAANKTNRIKITQQKASTSECIDFVFVDKEEQKLYKHNCTEDVTEAISEVKANYYNPLLSPDGSKAIVHIGAYIYLFAIDGSISKEKITKGLAHSWSPCGNYLFYFIDESTDGHTLDNSDLYVYNLQEKKTVRLTQTADKLEMWPAISPDGKQLLFTDARTGILYTANLKIEQ